jgi:hypothetical protein
MPHNEFNPAKLIYSWHATERMHSLQIDQSEVEDTVRNPVSTRPGRTGPRGSGRHLAGRHIIVLLGHDGRTVVTVKLRTPEPYVHGAHTRWNMPDAESA